LAWADFVKKWKKRYGQNAFPEAYTNNHYQAIYWFIEAVKKAGPKALEDHELLIDTMHNTSFQNVCISPMGPLDSYGSNWGATGTIIQFQPGAGKVDPSFSLHEVLITKVQSPKKDAKQILEEIKGIQKLEKGQVYPAGG